MDVAGKLAVGLENISSAPLKPQQHFYMLKTNLIPALYHQLVLAANAKEYLLWLDCTVGAALRSWLKLPHDTPKAYFHSLINEGGLGIVCLELQIPLLKIKRIERLLASNDPVTRDMLSMESAELILARQRSPPVYCGELITSKGSLRVALGTGVHTSVDEARLAHLGDWDEIMRHEDVCSNPPVNLRVF